MLPSLNKHKNRGSLSNILCKQVARRPDLKDSLAAPHETLKSSTQQRNTGVLAHEISPAL